MIYFLLLTHGSLGSHILSFSGLLDEQMSPAWAFSFTGAVDKETSAGLWLMSSSSASVLTMHRMNQERLHQALTLAGASKVNLNCKPTSHKLSPIILLPYLF